MFTERKTFKNDMKNVSEAVIFIRDQVKKLKIQKEKLTMAQLISEECLALMLENEGVKPEEEFSVEVKKRFDEIQIRLRVKGPEHNPLLRIQNVTSAEFKGEENVDEIRTVFLYKYKDVLSYAYKNEENIITFIAKPSERKMLYRTAAAFVLSILAGLILKMCVPESVTQIVIDDVLLPINTMFMAALKFVVVPVVFFSIVSCISGMSEISSLGRIAGKVMGTYMFTTIVAIGIGYAGFYLFHPGDNFVLPATMQSVSDVSGAKISIVDTIVKIIPENIVAPFAQADMLQIIFAAVLIGACTTMIGGKGKILTELFDSFNALFLEITNRITCFIPLGIFASFTKVMVETGLDTLVSLLQLTLVLVLCITVMILFYAFLVTVRLKMNPFTYLKKIANVGITAFALSSSSATMPVSMSTCTKKLGISSKISSFSIPLGATVNMDGSSIVLGLITLFLANVYGITLSPATMVGVTITIIALSIGSPGIPGGAIVAIAMLAAQVGLPPNSVGLIMGIFTIFDMLVTANNVIGDVSATLLVAYSEKEVDEKVLRG